MVDATPFSAGASLLGYLYQLRYALHLVLEEECDSVSIETLDDVVIENDNTPHALYQLKLHQKSAASLSDRSVDLWKSLRIWATQIDLLKVEEPPLLFLVTTTKASPGHAAAFLKNDNRDADKALVLLDRAAADSTNDTLKDAFEAYGKLSVEDKTLLLSRIRILDSSEDLDGIADKIKRLLSATSREHQVRQYFESLEGWWVNRALAQLQGKPTGSLSYTSIHAYLIEFRDSLQPDNLPLNEIWERAYASEKEGVGPSRMFVRQLLAISMENEHIRLAIQNYYRAFAHRSKWVRELLLLEDSAWSAYENSLVRELEMRRAFVLYDAKDENSMLKAGKEIYRWSHTDLSLPIRPKVIDRPIMWGALHMLADENPPRVWWHPQFLDRLEKIAEKELA